MEDEKVKMSLTTMIFMILLVCIVIVGFIYLLFVLKNNSGNNTTSNTMSVNTIKEINTNIVCEQYDYNINEIDWVAE